MDESADESFTWCGGRLSCRSYLLVLLDLALLKHGEHIGAATLSLLLPLGLFGCLGMNNI